jgi:YD repeat-containing protein
VFPTSVQNPLGYTEHAGYDLRMGTLTSVTDANSQTTTALYDVFGRPFTVVKPGDVAAHPTLVFLYYDAEQPVRYLVARREVANTGYHRPLYYYYDGLGRLIQEKAESQETSQQIVTDYRYDGLGRTTLQSVPRYVNGIGTAFTSYTPTPGSGVSWITTAYDALGRVSSVTEPHGAVTSTRYFIDSGFRIVDVTDGRRHRSQQYFDSMGRRLYARELSGNCGAWGYACGGAYSQSYAEYALTQYSYSPLDLLTQVRDAKGNTTTLSYDSLGRKTNTVDPDMGSWWYGYDANGNLTSQTDARNATIYFGYDTLDRLIAMSGSGWANYAAYDQAYGFGIGRRTTASTTVGGQTITHQQWVYDARGRVIQENQGLNSWASRSYWYAYDSADRQTSITYPSGEVVSYTYDAAWRQSSVCGTSCYVTSASATALSGPDQWTLGNGLVQDWDYDTTGRLSTLKLGPSGAPTSTFFRSYGYSYDHRDRLTWAGGSGAVDESYSYDSIGNLLQRSSSQGSTSYSYGSNGNGTGAGPHQARNVGVQSYSYDTNGNLTSGGGRSYSWDAFNRTTGIWGGGITDESYT